MATKPVHSPAPLTTAPPAGTGERKQLPPGSSTVTPVRATPRPRGGGGSSRHTVRWPRPTPGTSRTDDVGPAGRSPILTGRSAARGTRDSMHHMGALPPVVWSDDVLQHEPGAEIWVGVRT